MSKQATNTETVLLLESDLVPIALIAAEIGESVDRTAHRFGEAVVLDNVGMRVVSASVAREYFTERAEWEARRVAEQRRRVEEAPKKVRPAGVPGRDGMSAVEAMISQDPAFSTPDQDYGRFPGGTTTELLDAELAEGRRHQSERRAEREEKKRIAEALKSAKRAREKADEALGEKR